MSKLKIPSLSTWPTTLEEATLIQTKLRNQVITEDRLGDIHYVAGVDVGFKDNYTITQAAVAVLSFPDLQLVDSAITTLPTCFPYIPGFLSFREIPGILQALEKLTITPDLIICDGQGIAHPRRFGIACHLGVLIDVPTIGVAKSILVGKHTELPPEKGQWVELKDRGEIIGAVVRSRTNVKPLYVSVGHRISLATARDYVFKCLTKYRLPETTRLADKLSRVIVNNPLFEQ
ncbi:deoxyribonuclease V [Gloeothece verrucosa]|uniref:Endonuclease V n=1 Tax=Gloeothece verrucosa (strain PCC 7822) TaxID=497965 RepID=E0UJ53_GLOV7|nr:deoxyribonuclease V [Gloeothece verrucosa]ADN15756.1 Deoxyribonuclease V [Gloeothece verrucosa PCC 7822]